MYIDTKYSPNIYWGVILSTELKDILYSRNIQSTGSHLGLTHKPNWITGNASYESHITCIVDNCNKKGKASVCTSGERINQVLGSGPRGCTVCVKLYLI